MPVDASIPLQVRGLELNSPLDRYAKFEGIKNAQSQNRLADLAYGQKSKEIEQENMLAKLLSDNTNPDGSQNREGVIAGLKQLGRGDLIGQTQTGYSAQDEAKAKADIAKIDGLLKQTSAASQLLSGATPENYTQVVQQVEQVMPGSSKNLPPAYDKGAIDAIILQGTPIKDQLEARKAELAAKIAQDNAAWDRQHKTATLEESKRRTDVMSGDRQAALAAKPGAGGKPVNLSTTAQKELFEADDAVQSSQAVISLLGQAAKLNDIAYSGYGAAERAKIRSNLPGESAEANATIDLNNIITGQALESLKAIFGGMPTEGERAILMDMQASVDKTPKQRAAMIERAKTAAERRLKFNEEKAKGLRDGSYMTESAQEADDGDIFSQADAILGGM